MWYLCRLFLFVYDEGIGCKAFDFVCVE
jgi:hypothetical protein